MDGKKPKIVLIFSGKRKSGKDFCVNLLSKNLKDFVVLSIAAPIKRQYAKDNNLDFEKLLGASSYKENYRQQIVEYSENIRKSDPNIFLRQTIDQSNARSKSIWIISDARRHCDTQYFMNSHQFSHSQIFCIRICSTYENRKMRGWTFIEGIDDKETECGLDSFQDWDFIIENNGTEKQLFEKLEPIIRICDRSF